jgi:pyruvate,water dikinase
MEGKQYVYPLETVGPEHAQLVGAKAVALGVLRRAGLAVPPGFCLTAEAVRLIATGAGASRAVAELEEALRRSGLQRVAVRSSALAEDGMRASYAGQFESFLNVSGREAIISAIVECWASQHRAEVASYEQTFGSGSANGMAVLVQEQVMAEAAGVLFTLNPLNGDEDEMVIEAVWGLGSALVSGAISPDQYVVDAWGGSLRSFRPGNQHWVAVPAQDQGIRVEPLPEAVRGKPVLGQELVQKLVHLGIAAQELFGYPLDIEWALARGELFILQARPITRICFDPGPEQWTSGNYREVLPGFPCPLTISLSLMHEYGPALAELFRRLRMGKPDSSIRWGRVFFGRPYWNVTAVKRYNSIIPGFNERAFDATVGIEPSYEGDGIVTPWTLRAALRAVPVLMSLLWHYVALLRNARRFCARFEREVWPSLRALEPRQLSREELVSEVRRAIQLHHQANTLAMHISFLCAQAESDFAVMMAWVNGRLPAEERIPESDLLTGLASVRTAAPIIDLWDLAQWAKQKPALVDELLRESTAGSLDVSQQAGANTAWGRFQERFQRLVDEYCYMAEVDEDLSYPRWGESPELPLRMLRMHLAAGSDADPRRRLAEQEQLRQAAEEKARSVLGKGWRKLWIWPRFRFRQQLGLVRRYIWWREETRIVASQVFYHCRRVFAELGRRWFEEGLLERPEDIFALSKEQVLAGLEGKLSREQAVQAAERYRRTCRLYRNFTPPCTIGRGAVFQPAERPSSGRVFQGVPCSSGCAVGPARVVRSLEEAAQLQRGEILVAPYTNPGWTPLLNLAAGLVIEEGGLLSHGAVVAREYGVPTVLRVPGATEILRSGQLLRVDGSTGRVEILSE